MGTNPGSEGEMMLLFLVSPLKDEEKMKNDHNYATKNNKKKHNDRDKVMI